MTIGAYYAFVQWVRVVASSINSSIGLAHHWMHIKGSNPAAIACGGAQPDVALQHLCVFLLNHARVAEFGQVGRVGERVRRGGVIRHVFVVSAGFQHAADAGSGPIIGALNTRSFVAPSPLLASRLSCTLGRQMCSRNFRICYILPPS